MPSDRVAPTDTLRRAAIGGVVGPVGFVGAWVVGGAIKAGYSPVDDAISRLAAVGASTRPLMTAGFVCFGLSMPVYAVALRRWISAPASWAAVGTGAATLAVAAVPLGQSSTLDTVHGGLATAGYLTLVAIPILSCRALLDGGRRNVAVLSLVAGAVAGISLGATTLGRHHGFWQRLGLGVVDAWVFASAVAILLSPGPPVGDPRQPQSLRRSRSRVTTPFPRS